MKTLIFNGSPKKNGDTERLIHELTVHLNGEIKIVSCYDDITPCKDCRYCWQNIGCSINDEMQIVYDYIQDCDTIVFASPIWFSSLSGPLLNLTSRIQSIWATSQFQNKTVLDKEKSGVIILVGAQIETADIPDKTAQGIMNHLNVNRPSISRIYSLDTNNLPASKDKVALKKCREVAENLNNRYK